MLKKMILTLLAWGAGVTPAKGFATLDAAQQTSIKFRMNAGVPGDINRTHPFSVEPALIGTVPPTAYGIPVVTDGAGGVRMLQATDTAVTAVWGFTVRPFPSQQSSGGMTSSFGSATPPTSGVIDVLRQGYMIGVLNDVTQTPVKGAAVFIWVAATSGVHTQGGIETAANGGNTCALDPARYAFNSGPDAQGNVEIIVRA